MHLLQPFHIPKEFLHRRPHVVHLLWITSPEQPHSRQGPELGFVSGYTIEHVLDDDPWHVASSAFNELACSIRADREVCEGCGETCIDQRTKGFEIVGQKTATEYSHRGQAWEDKAGKGVEVDVFGDERQGSEVNVDVTGVTRVDVFEATVIVQLNEPLLGASGAGYICRKRAINLCGYTLVCTITRSPAKGSRRDVTHRKYSPCIKRIT